MGQNAHTDPSHRGVITIDWMVLIVACIAALFLLGTMVRISVDADAVRADGFRELGGNDTLLTFQDFSFDATGWDPSDTSDRLPGIGPSLGPFMAEPVQRSFAMPMDADVAHVTFDLHLIGDWDDQGDFHISVGGDEVLTIEMPDGSDASAVVPHAVEIAGVTLSVDRTSVRPRPADGALPGASDDFVTLRISVHVTDPEDTLTLRLMAEAEGQARWSLDNLTVVTTSGDGS